MSTIFTFAKYEFKIGRRNWLFRFFLFLIIFVTGYYHLYLQTYSTTYGMVTLPSSFPLINSFLFNFLQAILFPFIVLDLFSREKGIDSLEVVRTRPYNNFSYFLGKLFGFVLLYFVLSLASTGVALFIHVFMSDSPFFGWLYFFYPLTFSLPTFIFVLGLSVWFVEVLRNRMLAIIILLCILYLIITYCQSLLPLDLFARELPNGYSNITGLMEDLKGYLAQRFSFFFVGIGLLLSSFGFQRRLDSYRRKRAYFHSAGLLLILVGYTLGYSNVYRLKEEQFIREEYRNVYNKYTSSHKTAISYHSIICRLHKGKMFMQSNLTVENLEQESLKQVILYLNPSLTLTQVTNDNKPIPFKREKQAIIIDFPLMPGAKTSLVMEYEGNVDDRICYLDIPDKDYYHPSYSRQAYVPERRFSFISDNFTLLLPECLWYPVTQPPINITSPYETAMNLCQYNLRVLHTTTNTIVSQGTKTFRGDTVCFTTTKKLPGLTLCCGPFEQTSAQVNGNWKITSMPVKGHTIWPYSTEFMATQIFSHVEDYEGIYPAENLFFIEVPASVVSYFRFWKNSSELVQPEMVLVQEGTVGWKGQEEYQDPETTKWYHIDGLLDPYFKRAPSYKRTNDVMYLITFSSREMEYREKHKYCLRSLFRTGHVTPLEFPILNVIMRNLKKNTECLDQDIIQAQLYLNENHSLKDALHEKGMDRNILDAVVYLKGQELANYLHLHSSEEQFELFYQEFMYSPGYNWEQFKLKIQQYFNIDITDFLHKWYNSTSLPYFEIKDVRQLRGEGTDEYFTRLKIKNVGHSDGVVSLNATIHGNRKQNYYYLLERGACKEISIKKRMYELCVNTGISSNIPASFSYKWQNAVTDYSHDTISGIYNIDEREFAPAPGEIIVDNSDPGFRLIFPPEKILVNWFKHKDRNENNHAGPWSNLIVNSCYGHGKRDAWYKYAGEGDCKAIWETHIEESGYYEIFVNNIRYEAHNSKGTSVYSSFGYGHTVCYTICDDSGNNEIIFFPWKNSTGWASLGKFYFKQGPARIILDDRGAKNDKEESDFKLNLRRMVNWKNNMNITINTTQIIIADAVKWVKVE